MKVLVTGSSGRLGEAMVRTLREMNYEVVGLDVAGSPFTTRAGSITGRNFVKSCLEGVQTIFHTATLHKPHIVTHDLQSFVDTNITGTLNLLQEALTAGVERFIFTSTTSVFGDALVPPLGAPAAWITEDVVPVPKNIYGVTKLAAENLCQMFYRNYRLSCIVLRASRFFPEMDDNKSTREAFAGDNLKVNEFLYRRVDIRDAVSAHIAAALKATEIGFGKYIISATTPFCESDMAGIRSNLPLVLQKLLTGYLEEYKKRAWQMSPGIDRVYVNERARAELGWQPVYDFGYIINILKAGGNFQSPPARLIGSKGYHSETFAEGPYPVK